MAEPVPVQPDEDLELALRLHRELNAVPRRQRLPARNQAASAALKTLSRKHQPRDSESSSSESERSSQQKKRAAGGGTPSDNDSGSKRRRQKEEPGKRKPTARARPGRKPQHAAAADEARRKAAGAAAEAGQPRTHVKCFYAGLQHGVWLSLESLASRDSLAAAVSHAFSDDGVVCSSETATVVFLTADKQSQEFAGEQPGTQAADAAEQTQEQQLANCGASSEAADKWSAAARSAVRIYVR
ncbi:hypothetical protein D9Q98_010550 [Chlorella vulgaris]|uniref:Uncharacterized protein n=1 Tax=Chlorella vulgaris TaxID=3077 RepID=A0A9D4TQL3_CHLVU|nr:hypothetical protein D9Q98_010550 [Chlorella vulgaris]